MSKEKTKKKRLKGMAKILANNLEPLNNNEKFKNDFKDYNDFKILLNPKDGQWAGLITIDKGTISVDGIKNKPKKNLKKEVVGWVGFLQMNTNLFLDMFMGKLTDKQMNKLFLMRKLKAKGRKNLKVLDRLGAYFDNQ